jgi:hypothetical protein
MWDITYVCIGCMNVNVFVYGNTHTYMHKHSYIIVSDIEEVQIFQNTSHNLFIEYYILCLSNSIIFMKFLTMTYNMDIKALFIFGWSLSIPLP